MTKLTCLTAVLPLLILAGCGGSDDPTAPAPPAPPLVAGTIGASGGDLTSPDIALSVPPGALAADTDLSIHAGSEDSPFGTGAGSAYRVYISRIRPSP